MLRIKYPNLYLIVSFLIHIIHKINVGGLIVYPFNIKILSMLNKGKKVTSNEIYEALIAIRKPRLDKKTVNQHFNAVWQNISSYLSNGNAMTENKVNTTRPLGLRIKDRLVKIINLLKARASFNFLINTKSGYWGKVAIILGCILLVGLLVGFSVLMRPTFNNKNESTSQSGDESLSFSQLRELARKRVATLIGTDLSLETLHLTKKGQISSGNGELERKGGDTSDSNIGDSLEKKVEQVQDKVVLYTEVEIKVFKNKFNQEMGLEIYPANKLSPDANEYAIKTKSWASVNYIKVLSYFNDELINFVLNKPSYGIYYMGGKYALKETYPEPRYYNGITDAEFISGENAELEFLKKMINDAENFKDLGYRHVDGKKLRVIEEKDFRGLSTVHSEEATQAQDQVITVLYYIDEQNVSLYLLENYYNGELAMSLKTDNSKTYQIGADHKLEDFFNAQELEKLGVPIREIEYESAEETQKEMLISNLIQSYDVYYFDFEVFPTKYMYSTSYESDAHSKWNYMFDPDFNPNSLYVSNESSLRKKSKAFYVQKGLDDVTSVMYEIYAEKPEPISADPYYERLSDGEVNVLVDGKDIRVKFIRRALKQPDESQPRQDIGIEPERNYVRGMPVERSLEEEQIYFEFNMNNLWYTVTLYYDKNNVPILVKSLEEGRISLRKLDVKTANLMDSRYQSYLDAGSMYTQ